MWDRISKRATVPKDKCKEIVHKRGATGSPRDTEESRVLKCFNWELHWYFDQVKSNHQGLKL